MDKKKRIVMIALISLLVIVLGFVIVYWAVFGKEEVIALFERIKDFINRPLPIIGFSALTLFIMTLKLVSMSSWGKKALEEQERKFNEFKKQQEEEKAKAKEEAERYKVSLEKYVGEVKKEQWGQESDLKQVERFIQGLPFKGAKDFRLEHKGKEESE